jgi:hypothetical protein
MQHDWVHSTLGHGDTMCSRCKITNREAAALGEMNECSAPPPAAANSNDEAPFELDDFLDDECPNCGGEGVVYDCIDGQCLDAESGCELCSSKCDWCS